ncbi:MAG: BCCT family transporter [Actinomycetota bacterium]|jgi:choline/glycine/proline betaine transport protein|nr:BCCT family transporter [Rubrobacter sp.]MDQ3507944.1 BCCT family transporter [Actinomycetota bacterium]
MLQRVERALGLRTNPIVFFASAAFIVLFVAAAAVFPAQISTVFGSLAEWISASLGWLYILLVTVFVGFVVIIGFSRYGKLRLGPDGARPEYTNWAWFAMLFTAGIGSVLMFYGVAGPVSHLAENPMNMSGETAVAEAAINFELYHYGLHAWGVFGLAGLSLAYFCYRRGMPLRIRSAFHPIFGDRIHGPLGHAIDIFTVLGTVFGVAVTLGLAGSQVNAGITRVTGFGESNGLQAGIIAIITVGAIVSVALGLDRGIRRLGQLNMTLAIVLMAFVAIAGPTAFVFQGFVQSIGYYFQNFLEFSFWNQAYNDDGWQGAWTVFIWAWQISWAPFVGLFVARISYGRTIREFILGVLFAPLAFTMVWFSVFGGAALDIELNGAGGLAAVVDETLQVALFAMLEQLPLATITSLLALVIICIFFITSADSASLVLDTLTSGDDENSLARQRVFWAVSLGAIALVLLLAGGLDALSNVVTVTGLPFLIILALMSFSLLKALREEDTRPRAESGGPEERSEEPVSADGGGESRTREGEVTQSR